MTESQRRMLTVTEWRRRYTNEFSRRIKDRKFAIASCRAIDKKDVREWISDGYSPEDAANEEISYFSGN